MNTLHPALAFLRDRMRTARAIGADTLVLNIDGARIEIFTVPADAPRAFFAAGQTRLSYRCSGELSERTKESLRVLLLDLKESLAAGRVVDPTASLAAGGAWMDSLHDGDPAAWRDWVARSYRGSVEAGRRDECAGLPDCLDLRMRPPIQPPWVELSQTPTDGPCSRCGRARGCFAARDGNGSDLVPLRHTDAGVAEVAALRVLAAASDLPIEQALDAHSLLVDACGDRAVDGALPFEYSVRLPDGGSQADRLRFVSYYPLVTSDALRCEIHRGRRAAVRTMAARWLTSREAAFLDTWLECAAQTQPATLGLSIGVEMDQTGRRLQIYAHPEPGGDAERFVDAAIDRLGGLAAAIPTPRSPAVLVGLALAAGQPPALKLYYHRTWAARADTGLLPEGLGDLEPFNPGWGLAVQEHVDGRAEWVKWDFPVTTHYQDYRRFLEVFWKASDAQRAAVPEWLAGESFSPWPTWASLGRGGRTLYFHAR